MSGSTPSSGQISLNNLQTVFGGTNPINFSEYYLNAATGYTTGVSGIPNIGTQIALSNFYGKTKTVAVVNYMIAGNAGANMSGGNVFIGSLTDDSFFGIGNVGQFFWFGTDWGSSNNVQWCTNGALTFGGGSGAYAAWSPATARGVLMGQADRMTRWGYQSEPYTVNNHKIKRIIVNQTDYSNQGVTVEYAIRLIRGPTHQYIEIRFGTYNTGTGGLWNISDGGSFYNPFSGAPPVGGGASCVLRGDLNGYNWQAFNNNYVNL
jgi:hypothetical protein